MDGKKVEEKVRSLYINKYIIKRNNWIHIVIMFVRLLPAVLLKSRVLFLGEIK